MPGFILGEKSTQLQTFDNKEDRIPLTFVKTHQCYLVDVKWMEKYNYFSVQLGFSQNKNIKKPMEGLLKKAGIKIPLRFLKEIRLDKYINRISYLKEKKELNINNIQLSIGNEIKPQVFFKKGELVDITGISKGKGFQGVVKRHGFAGGPRTHGQSDRERAPGAIGQTTTPGRVFKGKRMAGRMGGKRVTIKNLEIIEVKEDGLMIKGLIPGAKGGFLEIRSVI